MAKFITHWDRYQPRPACGIIPIMGTDRWATDATKVDCPKCRDLFDHLKLVTGLTRRRIEQADISIAGIKRGRT